MSFQRPKTKAEHVSDSSVLSSAGRMGCYENDTAFLGQTGPFFVLLFCLLNAVYISTGLHSLYIVFVGASPSHHCRIADANLSEEWQKASIPQWDGQWKAPAQSVSEIPAGDGQKAVCAGSLAAGGQSDRHHAGEVCGRMELQHRHLPLHHCLGGEATLHIGRIMHYTDLPTAYTSFCFYTQIQELHTKCDTPCISCKTKHGIQAHLKSKHCLILQTPIFGYIIRSWSKLKAVL